MKIGLITETSSFYNEPDIRSPAYSDMNFVQAEISLPQVVDKALGMTEKFWSKNPVPLVFFDLGDHGVGMGMIFRYELAEQGYTWGTGSWNKSRVGVRISTGFTNSIKGEIDLSKASRYHISIIGTRQFFPEEFSTMPREILRTDVPKDLGLVQENVHVSLRWMDGKYDFGWNSPESWTKTKSNNIVDMAENKRMSLSRSTYFASIPRYIEVSNGNSLADQKSIERVIEHEGRKHMTRELSKPVKVDMDYFESGFRSHEPTVGFDTVREILGRVDLTEENIRHMSPTQGTDYLFTKVLSAVERFADQ